MKLKFNGMNLVTVILGAFAASMLIVMTGLPSWIAALVGFGLGWFFPIFEAVKGDNNETK